MTRHDRLAREIHARVMRRVTTKPSTCPTGKIQFVSEQEAAQSIRALRRREDPNADGLNAYRCQHCPRWHIGHGIGQQPP